MRIDKWLWAARFFKTRALAAKACELGRIQSNGQTAKAARDVRAGDQLHIKNDAGEFSIQVLILNEMRGPAAVAQTMYVESDESRVRRATLIEERKALIAAGGLPENRPSKKDRRDLQRLRGRG